MCTMLEQNENTSDFLTKFHNLQGLTVAEKKRSLFQLLRDNSALHTNESLLDSLTSQLKAESHLEELFLVEFLIYFRRHKELSREFIKGNDIVVNRISHQQWFFKAMFSDIGPDFVSQIIPTLCYSLRLKVLKKMLSILNENQADPIFDSLLTVYGLSTASHIITSCSSDKISNVIKEYSLKLWPNQLKLIYEKNPKLIYIYLEEYEKHEANINKAMDFNPFLNYLAGKNLDMYQDLCLKYNFKTKLGKRITKKFVGAKKQDIIADPQLYVKNLNPARLIRKLGPDFKQVYYKLFPRTIQDGPNSESSRLLQYYPKKGQYNLMVSTFNQIFANKLGESPHLIDEYILQMINDPDERERLAKIKTSDDPDSLLKYYRPNECFKIIRERMNFTRVPYERSRLVIPLVESCLIDNNYDALLLVAKYVTERFKNDSIEVQQKFLQVLTWQKCDFSRFTEDHWFEINKIMARPESVGNMYGYTTSQLFYRYVEFLIGQGNSIENEMASFFNHDEFVVDHVSYIQSEQAQKMFLYGLIQVAPQLNQSIENLDCKILSACQKFNSKGKYSVNVFEHPRLLQSLKKVLISNNKVAVEENTVSEALRIIICSEQKSEEVEELRQLYWTNIKFATPFITKWFLKNRPDIIDTNLSAFLNFSQKSTELNKNKKIWRTVKCYSHLNLDRKAIEFYTSTLSSHNAYILSHLMSSQDYITLVETFKSTGSDTDGDGMKFQTQRALLKGLQNIKSPVSGLSLILRSCSGDHVPSCLAPLYSVFYKIPLNQMDGYLNELRKQNAVSVKKHNFYLISLISDNQTVLESLRGCHLSQSIIIGFKYFLRNPSEGAWETFKAKLPNIDQNDQVASKLIASKQVPFRYKAQHFENVWSVLQKTKYKSTLARSVQEETIAQFKPLIIQTIIDSGLSEETNRVISKYLIVSKSRDKTDIVCDSLQKYKISSEFSPKKIHNFVLKFFVTYMKCPTVDKNMIDGFLLKFKRVFSEVEIFEECIILSVMTLKKSTDFAGSIIQLHNNLIEKFGETTTGIFSKTLKKLLPYCISSKSEMYHFCYKLLSLGTNTSDTLLLIQLLPIDSEPEDKDGYEYYERTLQHLQESNLGSIQLHLNLHFKMHKVARNVFYYERVNKLCINTSSWLHPGARRRVGYTYY